MSSVPRCFESVLFLAGSEDAPRPHWVGTSRSVVLETATSISYSETGCAHSRAMASVSSDENGISELGCGEDVRKRFLGRLGNP